MKTCSKGHTRNDSDSRCYQCKSDWNRSLKARTYEASEGRRRARWNEYRLNLARRIINKHERLDELERDLNAQEN